MKSPISGMFAALCVTAVAAGASGAPATATPKASPNASATPSAKPLSKWQAQVQEKFKNSAPADEYFGRMKLSFLGMNNTFRDAAISSGDHTTDPGIINKVALAEDALEAWGKKYPRDPQLARTYFLATQVDRKIWTKGNQDRAWLYLNRVLQLFPDTFFGKTLKKDLDIGFTEHYYALPVPCTTPPPTPVPSPADSSAPSFYATPTPEPTETPTPVPTAKPTSTVTTVGKGHRVEVIPQACVPPATPSPSPSPTASPSPSATPAAPDALGTSIPATALPAASQPATASPSSAAPAATPAAGNPTPAVKAPLSVTPAPAPSLTPVLSPVPSVTPAR